jgi:hypothetical protein
MNTSCIILRVCTSVLCVAMVASHVVQDVCFFTSNVQSFELGSECFPSFPGVVKLTPDVIFFSGAESF